MKTIIAGSRDISYDDTMRAIKKCPWKITSVVSGFAKGPDTHGLDWADTLKIPKFIYPADWNPKELNGKLDRAAGIKRNIQMAKNAEALIAVWDGKSKGTKHMIEEATKRGLRVFVYRTNEICHP